MAGEFITVSSMKKTVQVSRVQGALDWPEPALGMGIAAALQKRLFYEIGGSVT
jgi:hypothetical protein